MPTHRKITKSLVTGACGFIGSALVSGLIKNDQHVLAVDRNKFSNSACESLVRDISKPNALDDLVDENTVIYHMAAKANVSESVRDPYDDFQNTCMGIFQTLETARKKNCQIVFPSTASIFDISNKLPVTERSFVKPSSPYGAAKVAGEAYCNVYHRCYGIDVRIARMFSVYGIGMNRFFIYDVINKIMNNNKEIELLGDGNQIRDYLYIDDVVNGLQIIANNGSPGEDYNLASGQQTVLKNLANTISALMNASKINIKFNGESLPGDVPKWYGDITKINQIGFVQKISLEEGLNRTIKWLGRKK